MNASIKAKLALTIGFLVVPLLASCSSPNQSIRTPTPTLRVLNAVVPNAMPGEADIVVYPSATELEKYEDNAPLGRSIYFVTPASMNEVYEFYKTTYTGQGWVVNEKRITFNDADFVWADDEGRVPWNVGLGLDVQDHVAGGTKYIVWVQRQADPDNVPVIEGATNVKVYMSDNSLEELKELDLGPARVITYTIEKDAKAVLESYQYHMESYGWRSRDEKEDEVSFSYSYGVPERMYFNVAIIKAMSGSDSKTHVTVAAAGADLHPVSDTYTPPIARVAKLIPPPPEVPTYPGAKSTPVDDPRGWRTRLYPERMEAWTSPDTSEKVLRYYIDTLTKQGWKQVNHFRPNWYRFTYDAGPTCQSRHSAYLVVTPRFDNSTHLMLVTDIGCYVISGDE